MHDLEPHIKSSSTMQMREMEGKRSRIIEEGGGIFEVLFFNRERMQVKRVGRFWGEEDFEKVFILVVMR